MSHHHFRRLAIGCLAIALLGGLALWWPPGDPPTRRSDLGGALVGGVLIAGAVISLEWAAASRSRSEQYRLQLVVQEKLDGINLDGADLTDAYMARRSLQVARFRGTRLNRAVMYRSVLSRAQLQGADLRDVDAGRVVLTGANLTRAKVAGIDLGSADLRGVDFRGVIGLELAETLEHAVYDDDTMWPEGFDPQARGALHERTLAAEPDVGPECWPD